MNSQLRTYVVIALLLGSLGGMYYFLCNQSIIIWYGIPFTEWKSNHIAFQNTLGIVAYFCGMLLSIDSFKHKYWMISTVLIWLFNLYMLFTGLVFTNEIRTDEYVIYFTEIQTIKIAYLIYLGMFCRFLLESNISTQHKNLVAISIPTLGLGVYIILANLSRTISDETSYFILFTLLISGALYWFSRRALNTSEP